MPKLFMVSGYTVYFWSNENDEPIILASNGSRISAKELNELMEFISAQFFLICAKWKQAFVTEEIKFYC